MDWPHLIYSGPPVDDPELLDRLPAPLRDLLEQTNGLIAWSGGFHLRGAVTTPPWHSLRAAWEGSTAFATRYPAVRATDIPFAEEACGDQFLLRDGAVYRLAAETGEVDPIATDLTAFLRAVRDDGIAFLGLNPLLAFLKEGHQLQPGQLLSVYPPFCLEESAKGVSLRAVPTADRLGWLADLAHQLGSVPEGAQISLKAIP